MSENWNELQDDGPLEVKVTRKEPYALRSQVLALEVRCLELERDLARERRLATMVRVVVWIIDD